MRFSSVQFLLTVISLGLLLTSCDQQDQAAANPPPPEVTVSTPLVQEIVDWDDYIGQFESVQTVELRPRVTGYLVEANFSEGQLVEAGDVLFRIDPRPFEATLDEMKGRVTGAAARLENARSELERARDLVTIQAISVEEFDSLGAAVAIASSDLEAAQAATRAAELNVEFTRITAPINGRVSYRRIDVGNAVKADETLLTRIVSIDPMYYVFQGSESLYLKYRRQNMNAGSGRIPVRIRLQDETTPGWEGYLDFLDNTIDPDSGTIRGRAVVANPDGFLTPGMFGHLELQSGEQYAGILIPDSAIATRGAQRIVYVVSNDNIVSASEVTLGPLNNNLRVIRSGLQPDDRIIINGQQRARPGMPVQVTMGSIEAPAALDSISQPAGLQPSEPPAAGEQ